MSLDLNKLSDKLDESLNNETTETLTKFLTDKRMSNNKQSSDIQITYFIEDVDTNEWYKITLNDYPRWTRDPLEAFNFKTIESAENFLKAGLKTRDGFNQYKSIINYDFIKGFDHVQKIDIPRNLQVTEHQFIKSYEQQ
jgi:hypothetical protein